MRSEQIYLDLLMKSKKGQKNTKDGGKAAMFKA